MSDFLSQFTKENYDREKIKILDENEVVNDISPSKKVIDKEVSPVKQFVSDEKTYIREEATEIDPDYKNKQRKKIILGSIIAILLIAALGFVYNNRSHTNVPDLINLHRQEVNTWANKNNIQVIYDEQFNNEISEDLIVSQSINANEKIKKGSDIRLTVSLGPDLEEVVKIPDFNTLDAKEIEEWLKINKMRYIQVEYLFSNEIEKDKLIAFEIQDKNVDRENFMRKNKGLITLSKGAETFEKNILVLNFKNKTKQEVETWMKEKEFISAFIFEERYDDEVMEEAVISQSPAFGEKVAKDEVVTFVVSKGRAILTPNYANSELNTFDTINTNGATVINKEVFSSRLPYGDFVTQSVAAGTILNDSPETIVVVHYSIGKPYIKDLVGQSEGDLPAFFYEFRGKGANIKYTVHTIKDCEKKGTVIKASKNNEFVSTSDHVDVYVSDGTGVCETVTEGDE